jgi:hypothetical protein
MSEHGWKAMRSPSGVIDNPVYDSETAVSPARDVLRRRSELSRTTAMRLPLSSWVLRQGVILRIGTRSRPKKRDRHGMDTTGSV